MSNLESPRLPLPPFDYESAVQKVRIAEDAWNSRNPELVSLAYTSDSIWRNRTEFLSGRQEIIQFLKRKWLKELDYRLIKEFWAFRDNRIAVRFAYEWHDPVTGFVLTVMRIGSSMNKDSCGGVLPASTTCQLGKVIAYSTGYWAVVLTIIPDCPTSIFEKAQQ
jgi:hypothetical protein